MFVRRLPYIIYRSYSDCGYLTDNRNFGYDTASHSCLKVGDLLLSKGGSLFYSMLNESPQKVEDIVKKLSHTFKNIPISTLYNDALNFYLELSKQGFIICCENKTDCNNVPTYFSYDRVLPTELSIVNENSLEAKFWLSQQSCRLTRVHIDISSRCNENCVHCYIPSRNKCSVMPESVFDRVIEQCKSMHVINVTLSGGEPLLNENLKSFLLKCKEANFSINLLSNLTLLSNDLVDIIIDNPLISIQTSLYAMDAQIHDTITCQKGSFEKTKKAICLLHDMNVPLQINCPIMQHNVHEYTAVMKFARSLNITFSSDYTLFGCYDASGKNLGCRVSLNDVKRIVRDELSDINKMETLLHTIKERKIKNNDSICPVCKSSLCISNEGNVYPCEGWQRMTLGNVLTDSLQSIWEDNKMTNHLRNLKYQDFKKCKKCTQKSYCTTCLIMNANESATNDYMEVNPYLCALTTTKMCAIAEMRGYFNNGFTQGK